MAPRDRRALFVGAGAVIVVLLIRFAIMPLAAYATRLSRDTDHQERLLQRDRQLIAHAAEASTGSERLRSQAKEIARNADPILLQEDFEQTLRTIAAGWAVDLDGLQWLDVERLSSGIGAMRVQLGGRTDFEGVLGFLWTVEQGAALVVIERIDLNVDVAASASPTGMETLRWAASIRVYFDAGMPALPDTHSSSITASAANATTSGTGELRPALVSLPGPHEAPDATALPAAAPPHAHPRSAGTVRHVPTFLPLTVDEITQAVEADPFNPLRRRPAIRYSGSADIAPVEPDVEIMDDFSQLPTITLLGTSVNGATNTAIIRVGDSAARLVAEGDTLDGLHVLRIERSRATVVAADSTLTLFLKYSRTAHQ